MTHNPFTQLEKINTTNMCIAECRCWFIYGYVLLIEYVFLVSSIKRGLQLGMLKCTQAALCNITALQGYILYFSVRHQSDIKITRICHSKYCWNTREHAEEKDLFLAF